jgi:hypothetical protein
MIVYPPRSRRVNVGNRETTANARSILVVVGISLSR